MKTIKLVSASVVMTIASSSFAGPIIRGTSGVGGGGTSVSAEFAYVGQAALSLLNENGILSAEQANDAISNTAIFDVPELCAIDQSSGGTSCFDAYYDQYLRKIEFDRKKWSAKSCAAKFVLASHEYLRTVGLEDSNYKYSNMFYGKLSEKQSKVMNEVCKQLQSGKGPIATKMSQERKPVAVPYRTEIFNTTKDCSKLKSTGRGLSDDRTAYVISRMTCAGVSYSVIQVVAAPGYDDGAGVYTVRTSDLIN
jgi:hypothetical protein